VLEKRFAKLQEFLGGHIASGSLGDLIWFFCHAELAKKLFTMCCLMCLLVGSFCVFYFSFVFFFLLSASAACERKCVKIRRARGKLFSVLSF